MKSKLQCNLKSCFKSFFVLFIIMFFSCQNDLDESIPEENAMTGEVLGITSRSNSTDEITYPKGVIPAWVKDSLSPENYILLKKLSSKFKIKYYLLGKHECQDSCIQTKFKKINKLLANGSVDTVIVHSEEQAKDRSALNRIEILTEGESGSEVGGGDIDKGYDYASSIKDIDTFIYGAAQVVLKAYFTWQKNITTRDFKDITIRTDIVGDGLVGGSKRWIDGGSRADRQGDYIRYVVIGTAELFSGMNNVGLVLSRDVNRIEHLDPFN